MYDSHILNLIIYLKKIFKKKNLLIFFIYFWFPVPRQDPHPTVPRPTQIEHCDIRPDPINT